MTTLRQGSIGLRAMEPSDVDLLYVWENDPETWHVSGSAQPFSRKALVDFVTNAHHDIYIDRQLRLMVVLDDNETIGAIDLFDFCPFHQRAGVGILIDARYRNQGHAKTVLHMLARYCFETLALRQIYCHVAVTNAPSLKAFEGAGFVHSGLCQAWQRNGNGFVDAHFMQLLNPNRKD